MARHHGSTSGGKVRFGPGHIAGLFIFYAVLAFCVFAFTFFYAYTGIEFRLVILLTLVIGVIATFIHVKAGRRTRIDALIDRGP
jgi:hypothetical protein